MSDLWALKGLIEEGIPIVASYYFTSISMSKASMIYTKQDEKIKILVKYKY